jgi:hypothetical protein
MQARREDTDQLKIEFRKACQLHDEDLASALGPLHDERLRIDRIVGRLDLTDDLIERADLSSELARSVSRYEDTPERTLLLRMDGLGDEELAAERQHLRDALTFIQKRTTGIDPRKVHASDGQRFEDTLSDAVVALQRLLSGEDRRVESLIANLDSDERNQLAEEIAKTFTNASERPDPPHTAAGTTASVLLTGPHLEVNGELQEGILYDLA